MPRNMFKFNFRSLFYGDEADTHFGGERHRSRVVLFPQKTRSIPHAIQRLIEKIHFEFESNLSLNNEVAMHLTRYYETRPQVKQLLDDVVFHYLDQLEVNFCKRGKIPESCAGDKMEYEGYYNQQNTVYLIYDGKSDQSAIKLVHDLVHFICHQRGLSFDVDAGFIAKLFLLQGSYAKEEGSLKGIC